MGTNRRDFLILGAGAAAGTAFTPVPWKLLDDASIWTQNWAWTPRPPRGEVKVRYTACTLCGEGCGVRARCVADQPISVTGVKGHPVSDGTLCPYGFGAHHMPYHPARVRTWNAEHVVAAVAALVKQSKEGVAIIDEAPGRADSEAYRRHAEALGIRYAVVRPANAATLNTLAGLASVPADSLGFDLENARTLLAFGAPVLESWTTPGRVARLWRERKLRVVYAGPDLTPTASLADRFLRIRAGSEAAAAVALGRALIESATSNVAPAVRAVFEQVPFEAACTNAGVASIDVRSIAEMLKGSGPVLAVSGGGLPEADEQAIALLNVLLGSAGAKGGIVRRAVPAAADADFGTIPDGSLRVAIVDHGRSGGVLPWTALQPKLQPGATVVSISPYRAGVAGNATFVVPAPAWLESTEDAGTPAGAAVTAYTISPALVATPAYAVDGPSFLARVSQKLGAGADVTREEILHERVAAIHKAGRGTVFSFAAASAKPVKEYESADKLWAAFTEGACWTDEAPARYETLTVAAPDARVIASAAMRSATPYAISAPRDVPAVVPPLASKLDRESALQRREDRVYLNPADAAALGLRDGDRTRVESGSSTLLFTAALDPNVSPGTAAVADRHSAAGHSFAAARISKV